MRIFSFNLILAMDFLNKIAEFMTTGLADDSAGKPKEEIKPIKSQAEKSESVTVRMLNKVRDLLIKQLQ